MIYGDIRKYRRERQEYQERQNMGKQLAELQAKVAAQDGRLNPTPKRRKRRRR